MHDEAALADLPEALPLRSVAPLWRVLAIIALLATVILLLVAAVLGVAMMAMVNRGAGGPGGGATIMPVMPPGWSGSPNGSPTDDNLPYPTRADLVHPDTTNEEPRSDKARPSARQRFLNQAKEVWKSPPQHHPQVVVISPDGQHLAYLNGGNLVAGPPDNLQMLGDDGTGRGRPFMPQPGMPPRIRSMPVPGGWGSTEWELFDPPAWANDSRTLYVATDFARLCRVTVPLQSSASLEMLPLRGEAPAVFPSDWQKIVFVRSQPTPKVDAPGQPAAGDPTEVVVRDQTTNTERVVVPASASSWKCLAVSPDGTRLALVSDRGLEGKQPRQWRVFVLHLEAGEPKPLTEPADDVGPVCWTPDDKGIVYARSQKTRPADHWGDEPRAFPFQRSHDLFLWDLTEGREVRLSRGGGFTSPSLDANGNLYYLTFKSDKSGRSTRLLRVPLAQARAFAAKEPEPPARHAAAWVGLIDQVLKEAQASAELASLTAEVLAKVSAAFDRLYKERFGIEAPATLEGLGWQREELRGLEFTEAQRARLRLVLAAVEGEFLCKHHSARWELVKDVPGGQGREKTEGREHPFACVVNPFRRCAGAGTPLDEDDDLLPDLVISADSPRELLERAAGRLLVLTNAASPAQVDMTTLTDPDLARGQELFKQGKADEAERVLLALLKQEKHKGNTYLVVAVGKLLYDYQRIAALKELMERECQVKPYRTADARKFNLLGLAYLKRNAPSDAVNAFKNALRCDLHYGPGYLNLAQAYQLSNDTQSADVVLERCQALLSHTPYAADARQRLGRLRATQGVPLLPGQ